MVAALYVQVGGCYFGLPDVDPWPESRDARLYRGPWPVVAHPPCARWGMYAAGGPRYPRSKVVGDDGGCFEAAIESVRAFGGVLEHPAYSKAWERHFLADPPYAGGWIQADRYGGLTCCVSQANYGHRARKLTWLYACGIRAVPLKWGVPYRSQAGSHPLIHSPPRGMTVEQRAERRTLMLSAGYAAPETFSRRERNATPIPFRDLLLTLARSATQ